MSLFLKLISSIRRYKWYTLLGILLHILTAIFTVISIPLVIPFFQILFGISPSNYQPPSSIWDLEGALNYGFSRLIAMTDHFIALKLVCGLVLVVFLLKNLCRFFTSYFMTYVRNGILRDVRGNIWRGFENLSISEREDVQQGYLVSLITNDLTEVDHGILKVFELLFKTPLVIIGSFIFMVWLSPKLTLVAFVLMIFTLILIGGVSHVLKRHSAVAQESLSIMTILVDQYLSATKLLRAHQADKYYQRKFKQENEEYFHTSNKILRRRDLASPLAEFLGVSTIVILLYYGALSVFNDELQPETFFAFIFAFYNVIDPAKSFSREYANIQKGLASLDRINAFTRDYASEYKVDTSTLEEELTLEKSIEFDEVGFGFMNEQTILSSLSFSLEKGEKVGIVGPSGIGKSTIIDLLLNFYQLSKGKILLDGQNIEDVKVELYRSLFGLVNQTPTLFYGTVADNIVLDQNEDLNRLNEVLRLVDLEPTFAKKKIGDQNSKISGGEAQRVCLARLLYRDPQIYLLDEPVSQLDRSAQIAILDTINKITRDKTVIIISHQISLLKDVDKIIVLDEHQISDIGQYQELYERNDLFRRLLGN